MYRFLVLPILLFSCKGAVTEKNTLPDSATQNNVVVEAESFLGQSGGISVVKNNHNAMSVQTADTGSWLTYAVTVPVSGRYKIKLIAANRTSKEAHCWLEDYIDNKDNRTYNVTGKIQVAPMDTSMSSTHQIDGAPLAATTHQMKLHVENSALIIDKIEFELMKTQVPTKKVFKQKTDGKEWKMVWSDEFDGQGLPDTSKWTFDFGNWGWGNNELQYYTSGRTENARQENGNLIIEARKNDAGMPWSSARITTREKASFIYGKIDFMAKVPGGKGTWAAGWLLGDKYTDELSWPYCGEVDILENVGFEMDPLTGKGKTHASIHCGAYYFKLGNQPTAIAEVENMNNAYHLYSLEWFPERIDIFIDGKKYFEYKDTSSALSWPYNDPQNIILNLAMGGGWGGAKGMDPEITSQQFIIDYVRVYELQ